MNAPILSADRAGDQHIDDRLRSEPILWLATVAGDRSPHLVPVWFEWTDPVLTIFGDPNTRKIKQIGTSGAVSFALDTAARGGDVVLGDGAAELVEQGEVAEELTRFAAKYAPMLGGQPIEQWLQGFSQPVRITVTRLIAWRRAPDGSLDYRSLAAR